jgi:hypothetical protein
LNQTKRNTTDSFWWVWCRCVLIQRVVSIFHRSTTDPQIIQNFNFFPTPRAAHGNHRNTCTGTGTTRPCIQSCLSEHFYTSKTSTISECNRYTPFPTFLLFISTLPPICPFSTTPT